MPLESLAYGAEGPRVSMEAVVGPDAEEAALVSRLRAGDDQAFAEFVRTHVGRLLATARRFFKSEDDARDAVQEAFLKVHTAIDRFEGGSRLSTWVHRIVVNACLMKLRSRRRHPEEPIDALLPSFLDEGHAAEPVLPWEDDVVARMERRELRSLVRAAIDRLPETYRTVLLLRDIEELDTSETAVLLAVTENAVKIRLHRARQALRTLLDPHLCRRAR